MNRRKFALSWGRKIFFGVSWPLSLALTLIYLRSFIIPETISDWIYFIITFIGATGLLNGALYFLLYCPVALIFPTYYMLRIWSLLLVLALSLLIVADAISFSSYHLHIYSYLSELYLSEGFHHLIGSLPNFLIFIAGFLVIVGLIWILGEMFWRKMKGRFSNPIRNWYLALIVFCLGIGRFIFHYGEIHPKFAQLFPLNFNFDRVERAYHDNRKFHYPRGDLECTGKENQNVILIVVKELEKNKLTSEEMPGFLHLKYHGLSFNNHLAGNEADAGAFTLFYSVPASYKNSVGAIAPAIYGELRRRNYHLSEINHHYGSIRKLSNEQYKEEFRQWMNHRVVESAKPYFLSLMLESSSADADRELLDIVAALQRKDLLKNTHLIMTGASAASDNVPFLWISPERKSAEFQHPTSHYDLMPTLMQKLWACKKAFNVASIGRPLEETERDWVFISHENFFKIRNYKENSLLLVDEGVVKEEGKERGRSLIFSALQEMTKFYRPE
jgi:membrane-anchored protein YejM (alkaline phosphatase superfamily)